jgi:hypothetical protein
MFVNSMWTSLNTLTTCVQPFDNNACVWHGITIFRSKDFGGILSRICNY